MATSQRVQLLTNKSEEISVLIEFLSNPNLVANLEKEVKKLNSLTEEEEGRLHEAKILLQQKDKLTKELEELQTKQAREIANHASYIKEQTDKFEAYKATEETAIAQEYKKLDERKDVADNDDTRLRQWENKLKETAAKVKGLVGE